MFLFPFVVVDQDKSSQHTVVNFQLGGGGGGVAKEQMHVSTVNVEPTTHLGTEFSMKFMKDHAQAIELMSGSDSVVGGDLARTAGDFVVVGLEDKGLKQMEIGEVVSKEDGVGKVDIAEVEKVDESVVKRKTASDSGSDVDSGSEHGAEDREEGNRDSMV